MSDLLNTPNELLDEIVSYLGPLETSRLLITCRSLSCRLAPAMYHHAIAPKGCQHALHWAAERGHLPLLKLLLGLFPIDLPGRTGGTPLHAAARAQNSRPVLEHLLGQGADVNHTDHHGLTALHYACEPRSATAETVETAVRILIAHGADVNIEGHSPPWVPLFMAIYSHFTNVARVLLEAGANPNWGDPLIFTAARDGYTEAMELLLSFGVDINISNDHRSNPLLLASQYGYLDIVKLLVEKGANLLCADNDRDTPLVLAIEYKQLDIAEYLLGIEGVDIASSNRSGYTPLHLAALGNHDVVLQMLLDKGCPIDAVDRLGRTALHIAVGFGQVETVKALSEKGANMEIVNIAGETALAIAVLNMHSSIVEMLIGYGADLETGCPMRIPAPQTNDSADWDDM
ncbi:hypothetical protein Q9L58_002247 [Maublancomyces gigas]|uniref:Uncharacterized protein n=1 Tax=Discina gigas TaxID=1032678 RepID=A0ABR3GRX6_9PEZI